MGEEVVTELIVHIAVMFLGSAIGLLTYKGYTVTGSPTMLRLSIAFTSIGLGSMISAIDLYADGSYMLVSAVFSALGYAFIALAYSMQRGFRYMVPLFVLITLILYPFFTIPGDSLLYVIRTMALMLIVYGSTQCMVSSVSSRKVSSLAVASGISLMVVAEFVSWYGMIFHSQFYIHLAHLIRISSISLILVTIYMLIRRVMVMVGT